MDLFVNYVMHESEAKPAQLPKSAQFSPLFYALYTKFFWLAKKEWKSDNYERKNEQFIPNTKSNSKKTRFFIKHYLALN